MSGPVSPRPWLSRVWQALLVVVAVAVAARVVWVLMAPLLPLLLGLAIALAVVAFFLRGYR